jgi:hypothetical protein
MDLLAAELVTNNWFLVLIAEMLLLMIIKPLFSSFLDYTRRDSISGCVPDRPAPFEVFALIRRRAFTTSEKKRL